jgi:ABC-2 type transport system ATP-binding protein
LTLSQRLLGVPASRIEEMLHLVSLTDDEAGRRVRDYSLGMRQRLGIANALLGDPQVLILDEPANGLDPAGIRWMRDLLRGYAERGGTVLLSSHLLHEIEVVADDLVVIGNGRIVANGAKSDLLGRNGTHVRTRRPDELEAALSEAGLTFTTTPTTTASAVSAVTTATPNATQPSALHAFNVDADPEQVGHIALQASVPLIELRAAGDGGLEEMFLALTADTQREGTAA